MSHDPRLLRELQSDDPELRRVATQRIAEEKGAEAIPLLLLALGDDDWRVRKEAAQVAPAIVVRSELVVALVGALDEKVNIGLRNAAVEALVEIGVDAVVPAARALERLDADGRKLAVELLGGIPDERAIAALCAALADRDLNVRVAAAEALGGARAAGPAAESLAVSALTRALGEETPLMKLAALEALVRLDAGMPWATFEPFIRDPVLRRLAIAAAGRSTEVAALLALAEATGDASPGVARDAVLALSDRLLAEGMPASWLGAARDKVAASLRGVQRIRTLATKGALRARSAALVVLGLLRDPLDIPTLVLALEDEELSSRAELALRLFGSGGVGRALEASRHSAPAVRAATLSLIPLMAEAPEPAALSWLRDALGDSHSEVVAAAVTSLGAAGTAADLVGIASHANSSDSRVAGTARSALQALALRNPKDALDLARTIDAHGANAVIGCVLIGAVAEGGPESELSDKRRAERSAHIAFLRAALDHGDPQVRHAAVDALSSLTDSRAGDAAAFALADEDEDVVLAAVRALGRMRRPTPLMTLLRTTRNAGVVATTLLALREASPEDAFEAARPLLSHSDPVLACAAVEAIGQLGGSRREEGLRLALEHPQPEVVRGALIELARGGDEADWVNVSRYLEHESLEVRRLAADLMSTRSVARGEGSR
jgi:HEAT repeat protein